MSDQSVYDEIGGSDAVDAVVSDFYDRLLATLGVVIVWRAPEPNR